MRRVVHGAYMQLLPASALTSTIEAHPMYGHHNWSQGQACQAVNTEVLQRQKSVLFTRFVQ